jgi:peptide/nickel transport system substrate-binding protein
MRKKFLRNVFLLMVVVALAAGCATAPPTPAPTASQPTSPAAPTSSPSQPSSPTSLPSTQPAATTAASTAAPTSAPKVNRIANLTVGQIGNPVDITCWNWTSTDELDILQHIAEPLFRFDRNNKLVGVAAESWKMNSPTDWIINIRKGMKFQDPQYGEVTADDVIASLEACFKPDGRALPKQSGVIAKMKLDKIDDYTIHVTLPEPGNAGLPNDWLYTAITSKKYLEKVGYDGFNQHPMGAGPFKFVEWIPNVQIVADRFADYWGPDPGVDRITWKILPDPSTRKSEFLTGGLDILPFMDASWLPEVKANPNVRAEPILSARYIMVILPVRQPPYNDKRVRQALNYAVNKAEIVQQLFAGVAAVLPTGIVNPILPEGRPDNHVYPYDPAKAKQLLDQARADGVKIGKITLYAPNDRYALDKEMGEAVAGYWRAIGLDVNYVPESRTVLFPDAMGLKMKDPFMIGFGNTKLRADYPFSLWLQTRSNPRSRGAEYAAGPAAWDTQINTLASLPSGAPETIKLAQQLDDEWIDYAPWVFVTNYVDQYGVSNKIDWKPYSYEMRYFIDVKPRQ